MILREQVMFNSRLLPNMSDANRARDYGLLLLTLGEPVPTRYLVGGYERL